MINISIERQVLIVFLFLFFLPDTSFGQSNREIDSLVNWSYEKLYKRVNESFTDDESLIYTNAYLKKAKIEKDTVRICNAFTQLSSYHINDPERIDLVKAISYCDSIIEISSPNFNNDYPGWGYLYKGLIQFHLGEYENSLNNYSVAYKLALSNDNDFHIFRINDKIAQMKLFWGDVDEALEVYKYQLSLIHKNENLFSNVDKLNIIFNVSNAYILNQQIDSAQTYNDMGFFDFNLEIKENDLYPNFLHQSGEILFHKKLFSEASDSILKSMSVDKSNLKSENSYNLLGQIAAQTKDTIRALEYFKKADEIIEETKDYIPDTKIVYTYLRDYYLQKGDLENFQLYSKKLIITDSALTKNYKLLNRKLIQDFEIPKIIIEKDKSIVQLEKNQRRKILPSKVLFIVGAILVIAAFVYIGRKKLEKKKEDPLKDMNPDVVERILNQLKNFEDEKMFTDKKYNLKTISKKFQTNSSYLSRVINARKRTNVSSYLTNLRIDYCIYKLRTDKSFRKFDVKSLAQEFGFNNPTTFSKAFSERTGSTPAAFIKGFKK